ncbi:MAG: hypothetical protein MUE82_11755 [Chloroflexi bacterium]|nr:hypothetical protein [Chloroflexota bacterium]
MTPAAAARHRDAEPRLPARLGIPRTARPATAIALVLALVLVLAGCSGARPSWTAPAATVPEPDAPASNVDVRAELRSLIEDITAATASRYTLADDRGRWMDTLKVIEIPEAGTFAAVYHTWTEEDQAFHVELATSPDLLTWTWQVRLADRASQPTIAASSDGGYVVAWEQEPDPIHLAVARFATWDDLLGGVVAGRQELRVTMRACGEGTPSIESANARRIQLGFHYHGGCARDREAGGTLDGRFWDAHPRPEIDGALIDLGVAGHIGDRDRVTFRGRDLMLVEGQRVLDDPGTWRVFLYDQATATAEELHFRTRAGSTAFSNPTITLTEIGGRPAVVVTLYLLSEGARGAEDGPLLYYRLLPDGG